MERVTMATVRIRAASLSRRLPHGVSVSVESRNGYVALDEYHGTSCIRNLTVGTKREVADFLHAAMVGIDLSRFSV